MSDPRNNPRFKFYTPVAIAKGHGAAGHGFKEWWVLRTTAAAGLILILLFLGLIFCLIGKPYEEAVRIVAHPFSVAILATSIIVFTLHMKLGMQVILEDYVRPRKMQVALLIANLFFCCAVAAICLAAVFKIMVVGS